MLSYSRHTTDGRVVPELNEINENEDRTIQCTTSLILLLLHFLLTGSLLLKTNKKFKTQLHSNTALHVNNKITIGRLIIYHTYC